MRLLFGSYQAGGTAQSKSALRHRVIAWTLVVGLLIIGAGYMGYQTLASQITRDATDASANRVADVNSALAMSNQFYLAQTTAAMNVLKEATLHLGPPHLSGTVTIGTQIVPNLVFGTTLIGQNFDVVDKVKTLMGGTATLFVHDGDRFVRISTNVQTASGQRAVGTILDPKGAVIKKVRTGQVFSGVVDILGRPYITEYDPILDDKGQIIGIWYVGYKIETFSDLLARIADMRILDHGFVALLDNHNQIVAHSNAVDPLVLGDIVTRTLNTPLVCDSDMLEIPSTGLAKGSFDRAFLNSDWDVERKIFTPWGYTVIVATYLPDVFWRTFNIIAVVMIVTGLVGAYALFMQGAALLRTRELRAEAEKARLAAEEANRTKSAFLANMSHELRTPLNAIIGYSEMLIEEAADLADDLVPDLEKILGSGKHLLALINDILDLSKIEAGKMNIYTEDIDVVKMITDVVSTIRPLLEKNGNTLDLDCLPEGLGTFHSDLTKTRQILFNLLSNASKFTKEGIVHLSVHREGSHLVFRVTDTGIGMTPEQMQKLFKEFSQADDSTTRKFGGTGLGLVLCKRFSEMMGGSIAVESTIGIGSTFTVNLPLRVKGDAAAAQEKSKPAPASTPAPAQPASTSAAPAAPAPVPSADDEALPAILVIDDDPQVQDLLKRIMEKERFRVVIASSGEQALELCRQLKPCLITLDVMMPGLDGWAVLSKLKADPETFAIPVIMVTVVNDKHLGFALGADDYVTKPFDRDKIIDILRRYGTHAAIPTILIVDDDAGACDVASRALERNGFRTLTAPNGRAALEVVAEAKPDLIILDLMMPEMNGFDFVTELRRREIGRTTPVLVLSAKDITAGESTLLHETVQEILSKGDHSAMDLIALVKKHLRAAPAPEPSAAPR
jgi:signal transduction histidine kinase/DNA-binding response OmpR family regulator